MKLLPLLFSGLFALGSVAPAEAAALLADGAKVEVLGEGYVFTE
jgi:hypothetical protein